MSFLSVSFTVRRRIKISQPLSVVFEKVVNFSEMEKWSPWLVSEREAKVEIRGNDGKVGAINAWDGEIIGAGESEIVEIQPNKKINYELRFMRPWKSQAKFSFEFVEGKDSCEVIWDMDGSLPVFMFWMKKSMSAWIGMDYVRGLYMLKEYCETGQMLSKVEIKEPSKSKGFHYIGIKNKCAIDQVGLAMSSDFERLEKYMKENDIHTSGTVFSIYHNYDLVKRTCHYTSGFSVKSSRSVSPDFVSGFVEGGKSLVVEHTGIYQNLGNAWSAGYSFLRYKKMKLRKGVDPLEIYVNHPKKTAPEELKTVLYLPVK